MALLAPHLSYLVVRFVHVLGMATLFGGAVLVWWTLRLDAPREGSTAGLRAAATYEWLFWVGTGLLVLTGVGNLGAMAPAIPGPATAWGVAFSTKLLGALVLLLGSVVRTLGVASSLAPGPPRLTSDAADRLRVGYAATAVVLFVIVALAEVLAHG